MDDEWISAAESYRLVTNSGVLSPQRSICSRACDGLIDARARRLVLGEETFDDCSVGGGFWHARGAKGTHNWITGDFETRVDNAVARAYGVEFRRSQIYELLPGRPRSEPQASASGNYAAASRCLNELTQALVIEPSEAAELILKNCRAGLVPSRCASLWWRKTTRYGPEVEEYQHTEVPDWVWEHCLNETDAVLNWPKSIFAGRGVVDDADTKVKVTGVQFEVAAIVAIESLPHRSRWTSSPSPLAEQLEQAKARGRKPSERWPDWVAELAAVIHNDGIPGGVGSQGQEELIRKVADALAERGLEAPGRTTVQPVVQTVLNRLRAAGN